VAVIGHAGNLYAAASSRALPDACRTCRFCRNSRFCPSYGALSLVRNARIAVARLATSLARFANDEALPTA
jgi:hypothetical protein